MGSMKEDGVVVDSWTFKLIVDAWVRAGKLSALEILDQMVCLGAPVNFYIYNSVIIALVRKGQVGSALSMFCKLLDSSSFDDKPTSVVCNDLLVALRKSNMKVEFIDLLNKLREKEWFELDTCGYNICIHAFGCWGDSVTALKLFDEMKVKSLGSGSFGPDLCTYNSLIQVLCLSGKVKDALIVYEEMNGSGHEPDEYTYRILVQGCSKAYRMEDALKTFDEMQYNGFQPNVIVYNSLLDGLLKSRRVVDACKLFDDMVQDGVKASCWTYNILIDGLFRNGRAEGAYTLFCDLRKKGQFVDNITYSIVIMQLCKEGLLGKAWELVEEMIKRDFEVDLVTVTSLVIGFHKQGRWAEVETLMKHITDGPTVLRWKANIEAALERSQSRIEDYTPIFPSRGDLGEILDLTQAKDELRLAEEESSINDEWSSSPYMDRLASQAKSGNYPLQLFSLQKAQRIQGKAIEPFDIDMVNTFLCIFLSKGELSLACKLFEVFSDLGVDPTSFTYNSLMSSFVKKGYFDKAWGVLSEMGEKICPTDIATYNMLIQGLGKTGKADLASSILDKLEKYGGYLDIVMYNTLINALGSAGRLDEACKLFEHMKASGISPDVVSFNTVINVHAKAGRLDEARKFLRMMLDAGCSPNHVTDSTLELLQRRSRDEDFKRQK